MCFFLFSYIFYFREFLLIYGSMILSHLLSFTEFTKVKVELFCCGFHIYNIKHFNIVFASRAQA